MNLRGIIMNRVRYCWEELRPGLEEKQIIKKRPPGLREEIKKAHRQWLIARHYFENVSDPELVDHASYLIQAARKKYMYLLNKAREM